MRFPKQAGGRRRAPVAPRLAAAWLHRGVLRRNLRQVAGAVQDCTRAIELDPKLAMAWGIRGLGRAAQGNRRAAAKDLRRYLELARKDDSRRRVVRAKLAELD